MRQPQIHERKRAYGGSTYNAQISGKQVGLGADRKLAQKRFGELLADRTPKDGPKNLLVVDLLDAFIAWCRRNTVS